MSVSWRDTPSIGGPYDVFIVDLDGMGKVPFIQMMADLPDVLSFGVNLEQLSRCRTICRTSGTHTREDENMPLRIGRHACSLPEI